MKRMLAILMTIAIFGVFAAGCGGGETETTTDPPKAEEGK
jgi:hypothetical protein